ncbi:MAG: ATP-binding protein [Erysipelotrichaceae bacterium]|nr:ATP-binding protein [Erysipelotrichaceae bacterium]
MRIEYTELKKAQKECPKKIYDSLSSFSNQDEGGIIIFGIDEESDYAVTGVDDPQKLQKSINEKCKEMEPVVRPFITSTRVEGKTVVAAEIEGMDYSLRPFFYKQKGRIKGSYVRVGDSDESMTETEIYAYDAFKKDLKDDLYTTSDKLFYPDESLIKKYIGLYRANNPNSSLVFTDEDILNFSGVYFEGRPTLAGILVFSQAPQLSFPEYSIICLVVPGKKIGDKSPNGARFLENRRINGSITTMLDEAVAFVARNSRMQTRINEQGKRDDIPEYPIEAVREAILNALIHRDYGPYTRESSIRVAIYDDRLEITSPGGLYGNNTVEQLGVKQIETRNGRLVRILEDLNVTEHRFSGIPTIYNECQKYGFPKPEFISKHGEFTVIFHSGSDLSSLSNHAEEKKIEEEAHEVLQKNNLTEENLLEYCKTPRTRKEISEFFNLRWDSINRKYIRRLLQSGELTLTVPESPRSPYQQFKCVKISDK